MAESAALDSRGVLAEWIVVSDGDARDLRSVYERLTQDLTISCIFLELPTHVGLSLARNEGVGASSAELLTWLDADDVVLPEEFIAFIEEASNIMTAQDDVLVAVSDSFDSDQKLLPLFTRRKGWLVDLHRRYPGTMRDPLLWVDFVYQSQLIRREDFVEVGGFSPGQIGEDVDFILKLYEHFPTRRVVSLPHVAYNYRGNVAGIVSTRRSELRMQNVRDYSRAQGRFWGRSGGDVHFIKAGHCTRCNPQHLTLSDSNGSPRFFNCFVPHALSRDMKQVLHDCV